MKNKKESLSVNLSKLLLTVSVIVSFGALIGAVGYLVSHPQQTIIPIINPEIEKEITIVTDKTEYEQGEIIKIVVNNGLDKSILYSNGGGRFWDIEYFADDKWINPDYKEGDGFQLTKKNIGEVCYIALYERSFPEELTSQLNLTAQWNQKICPFGIEGPDKPKIVKYIESGKYRLVFGYGFEISSNDPFKISEPTVVYSNEFTIKEKTAIDPQCGKKAKFFNYPKECEVAALGYEFDSIIKKCSIRSSGECGVESPFSSLEECQKTCETSIVARNELKFKTIEKESQSNNIEAKNYSIKNNKEWTDLWTKISYARLVPIIDFTKDMVIAVFQGEYSTGGYDIEIQKIIENEKNIEVFVKEISPGINCMVPQSFTSPFHIVKIQKSDKKVAFKIVKIINDCD